MLFFSREKALFLPLFRKRQVTFLLLGQKTLRTRGPHQLLAVNLEDFGGSLVFGGYFKIRDFIIEYAILAPTPYDTDLRAKGVLGCQLFTLYSVTSTGIRQKNIILKLQKQESLTLIVD